MSIRIDTGGLWENFCIVERLKYNANRRRFVNSWFWRTYDQKEVDYIEEEGGKITAFEFKFMTSGKVKLPEDFIENYPGSTFKTVSSENYLEFLSL